MTAATQFELAAKLQAADDAWNAELVAHFGANAGTMRYSHQGQIGPFAELYAARRAARCAWEAVAYA